MALAPDPPLLTTLVNDLIIINIDLIIVEISEVKITDQMMKEENTDTGQTYIERAQQFCNPCSRASRRDRLKQLGRKLVYMFHNLQVYHLEKM